MKLQFINYQAPTFKYTKVKAYNSSTSVKKAIICTELYASDFKSVLDNLAIQQKEREQKPYYRKFEQNLL